MFRFRSQKMARWKSTSKYFLRHNRNTASTIYHPRTLPIIFPQHDVRYRLCTNGKLQNKPNNGRGEKKEWNDESVSNGLEEDQSLIWFWLFWPHYEHKSFLFFCTEIFHFAGKKKEANSLCQMKWNDYSTNIRLVSFDFPFEEAFVFMQKYALTYSASLNLYLTYFLLATCIPPPSSSSKK